MPEGNQFGQMTQHDAIRAKCALTPSRTTKKDISGPLILCTHNRTAVIIRQLTRAEYRVLLIRLSADHRRVERY